MFNLFKSRAARLAATPVYDQAVKAARDPRFYRDYGVPDTLDGRFEMIVLQVFLAIQAGASPQALFDAMFVDMERSLREMGVGDLSVPKKIKAMMRAFNGRLHAYHDALAPDAPDAALVLALHRNVYGTVADVDPAVVAKLAADVRARANDVRSKVPLAAA